MIVVLLRWKTFKSPYHSVLCSYIYSCFQLIGKYNVVIGKNHDLIFNRCSSVTAALIHPYFMAIRVIKVRQQFANSKSLSACAWWDWMQKLKGRSKSLQQAALFVIFKMDQEFSPWVFVVIWIIKVIWFLNNYNFLSFMS